MILFTQTECKQAGEPFPHAQEISSSLLKNANAPVTRYDYSSAICPNTALIWACIRSSFNCMAKTNA